MRLIAKGARKMRSRKAGHLEPFTRVSMQLAKGRDLWIVTQADTVDAYLPVREDLTLTGNAAYVLELLDRFSYEEGENRAIYALLVDTLARLSGGEDVFLTIRYYEIRLLDYLGFRPDLQHCVQCQREIQPQDQFFSALHGGVLCPDCGMHLPGSRPISMQALKYMRHLQRSSFADIAQVRVPEFIQREMEMLLQYYLTYLLERGLNSQTFMRKVKE